MGHRLKFVTYIHTYIHTDIHTHIHTHIHRDKATHRARLPSLKMAETIKTLLKYSAQNNDPSLKVKGLNLDVEIFT